MWAPAESRRASHWQTRALRRPHKSYTQPTMYIGWLPQQLLSTNTFYSKMHDQKERLQTRFTQTKNKKKKGDLYFLCNRAAQPGGIPIKVLSSIRYIVPSGRFAPVPVPVPHCSRWAHSQRHPTHTTGLHTGKRPLHRYSSKLKSD